MTRAAIDPGVSTSDQTTPNPIGRPHDPIRQVDVWLGDEELGFLSRAISERWITEGHHATAFATAIREFAKTDYMVFAPNGTLGLYLGLLVLDLPRGSEILIPSFTFYGSAAAAVFAGLKPVFIDCYPDTFNIDIEDLESKVTPSTSAIMPVHVYGQICDMDGVLAVARKYKLKVIEDAAQAFGVHFNGRHAGTFGDVGVFSFFSDKSIAMGEGGALFFQSEILYERARMLRNQGRANSGTFEHPELGMNFRITDLQAGIGRAQFAKFPQIREHRLNLWKQSCRLLNGVGDIKLMKVHPNSEVIPFRIPITTDHKAALQSYLNSQGIETRNFFYPMHLQPRLRADPPESLPVSERLMNTGLCLPVHHNVSEAALGYICDRIHAFFQDKSGNK
jgi:perosamine synthetase